MMYKMLVTTASVPQTLEPISSLFHNLHIVTKSYCSSLFTFRNPPIYFFSSAFPDAFVQVQATGYWVDYGKALWILLTSLHTVSKMYFLT